MNNEGGFPEYTPPNELVVGDAEPAASVPASALPASLAVTGAGTTWWTVMALAWPVLAQQLLILAVALSDQFLAGHFKPKDASRHVAYQSAQTTAIYLSWLINSYTILVTVGSTALVARFIGAGDSESAVRVTGQSILLAVALGVLGTVVGLAGLHGLIWALELRGYAGELAVAYLQPLIALLVFQVVESAGIACLIGAGDTRMGLWVLGGVAVLNLPLSWGLFLGVPPLPEWGFAGIALGTALSNVVGCLVVLAVLARGRAGLRLEWRGLVPSGSLLRRLLNISVPAGMDSLSGVLCQLWFLSIVNRLSEAESGAHGIALRLEALGYLSGGAFGTAAMALVGQNLGAHRPDHAARCGWLALRLGCLVMCIMGVLFFALAYPMFGVFCPHPEQRPVVEAGVPVLQLIAFAMPPLSCTIIFTYALRGAGDTRVPLLFTWIGFLGVRIPLAYFLALNEIDLGVLGSLQGMNLGLFGAWLAMFADILVRSVFFLFRFASGHWQRIRV